MRDSEPLGMMRLCPFDKGPMSRNENLFDHQAQLLFRTLPAANERVDDSRMFGLSDLHTGNLPCCLICQITPTFPSGLMTFDYLAEDTACRGSD